MAISTRYNKQVRFDAVEIGETFRIEDNIYTKVTPNSGKRHDFTTWREDFEGVHVLPDPPKSLLDEFTLVILPALISENRSNYIISERVSEAYRIAALAMKERRQIAERETQ